MGDRHRLGDLRRQSTGRWPPLAVQGACGDTHPRPRTGDASLCGADVGAREWRRGRATAKPANHAVPVKRPRGENAVAPSGIGESVDGAWPWGWTYHL
jgi:hypothetical protein